MPTLTTKKSHVCLFMLYFCVNTIILLISGSFLKQSKNIYSSCTLVLHSECMLFAVDKSQHGWKDFTSLLINFQFNFWSFSSLFHIFLLLSIPSPFIVFYEEIFFLLYFFFSFLMWRRQKDFSCTQQQQCVAMSEGLKLIFNLFVLISSSWWEFS